MEQEKRLVGQRNYHRNSRKNGLLSKKENFVIIGNIEISSGCFLQYWINYKAFHHHHVTLLAWISQTLSRHPSQSSITPESSSRLYPVSAQSCCILVLAGLGVYRNISLMRSFLFLQQCPACLVRLTLKVLVMSGRLPYGCCFVGCCFQDWFSIARSILV